jgi:hypothetical protein
LKTERSLRRALLLACLWPGWAGAAESLLDKLLRISGLGAAPGQQRSDEGEAGSLWLARVDAGAAQGVTATGGFRSPVFTLDDAAILALRADQLVRVNLPQGEARVLRPAPGVRKLVGFDPQSPDELLVLMDSAAKPLAALSLKTGAITALAYDPSAPEQQRLLGQIRAQDRVSGKTSVSVQTERRQGLARAIEWTAIFVRQGDAPARNVSGDESVNCSQPAISHDTRRVVFVKADH